MNPWNGRETADLVYNDTEGDLTALLVEHGYLDPNGWHNARPKFFIEVKTTTGPLETPFYLSKYQHRRVSVSKTLRPICAKSYVDASNTRQWKPFRSLHGSTSILCAK